MGFLEELRAREIKPLAEGQPPNLADDRIESTNPEPSDLRSGVSGGEAPPQVQEVVSTPSSAAAAITKPGEGTAGVESQDDFPEESYDPSGFGESEEYAEPEELTAEPLAGAVPLVEQSVKPTPVPQELVEALQADAEAPGRPRGRGDGKLASGHTFPEGLDLAKKHDRQDAVNAQAREANLSSQTISTSPNEPAPTENEAMDRAIVTRQCQADARLIARKLRPFSKMLYLNPMWWDSRTVDYVIKSYKMGVSIKAIFDSVSSPSSTFADSNGNHLPTFRQTRAEVGNMRLIDLYALLATCIYHTTCGEKKGVVKCLDGPRFAKTGSVYPKEVEGLAGPRTIRHDGEIKPTTFVDLIFFDKLHPGRLGHAGLNDYLSQYDETMNPGAIRRLYDTVLTQFRRRWQSLTGADTTRGAFAKQAAAQKITRQFDEQLTNNSAILELNGRKFILMEWPHDLPTSLPQFKQVASHRRPLAAKIFLRKFCDSFDPALPFNQDMVQALAASMGPQAQVAIEPVQGGLHTLDPFG